MDKKIQFITKELVEKAAQEIDKKGIPSKRDGKEYSVVVNDKEFPFKLLITEAAKLVGTALDSTEFGSSPDNRKGFKERTGFPCIKKTEKSDMKELATTLRKTFNEIWRCADSYKWDYLKGTDLLTFNWIDKNTDYHEVDLNSLKGGKKTLKPWINSLKIGDLIFVMGGNTYNGIAIVKSTYSFKGPFIEMGDSGLKPAIRVQYIHKVNNPINHNIKTHNNPTTFAKIDQYKFGLDNVLNFLDNEVPDAITALLNYINSMDYNKYIDLLKHKKQIILQGPPGTGKTYTAKDIAEMIISNSISGDKETQKKLLESSEQFQLIQFHPAYTYEDFVRGITAKSKNGGAIEYSTENKVFASFAAKAWENYLDSKKSGTEITQKKWIEEKFHGFVDKIQDKIDNGEDVKLTKAVSIVSVEQDDSIFRYTGKTWKWTPSKIPFKDIIHAYLNNVKTRTEFKNLEGASEGAKNRSSYFFKTLELFRESIKNEKPPTIKSEKPVMKHFVIIIDEINRANLPSVLGELIYALEYRNESVDSMYSIDGDASIIIPENLYIIGTMNTADRSVGHIDYAIRRRFAFESLLPDREIIETDKGKEYFNKVEKLFSTENLSADYKNSKEDVQIGHSYFMGSEVNLSLKMEYEVIPILKEYLKDGIFKEEVREKIEQLEKQIDL